MTVLIVDDSATIRMILKGQLKKLGFTNVIEASDGRAAIEMLTKNDVGLLMLDIHMPDMGGLNCLEALKRDPAHADIPVIIVSSDTAPAQIESARSLGVFEYIRKPFRIEGLRDALVTVFPTHDFQIDSTTKNEP